ncbi:hypothetical protein M8J76_007611 [Diaphorina citri]|nr:hypothetical protein M8J76_007611 [Diaphorina citri]
MLIISKTTKPKKFKKKVAEPTKVNKVSSEKIKKSQKTEKLEAKLKKKKSKLNTETQSSVEHPAMKNRTFASNVFHQKYEEMDVEEQQSEKLLAKSTTQCNSIPDSLPQVGFTWGMAMEDLNLLKPNQDDSEDEEEEVEIKKVKPKLTKAEKLAAAKAEEARIRQAEDELLQNGEPVSPDGFDRMLLGQPNNSELWVKYMAYHLQATEIEKARSIARRALTVINIRNEEDRLNVWTSLLNLEHLYGTKESLQECLHEAVRCNDETKVYMNMMEIYAASAQIRDLESTVKLLLKKAGQTHSSVNIYLQCATLLLRLGQKDTARHILQRGLNNLPPAVHVTLITRFALAENKFGDASRAQALLEHTLTSYPARVDVWGVYVDMLVKSDRVDLGRQVIQRAVTQKLPPKKLKPLYMKWLKLEEQYGDAEAVENVKKEIEQYVRNSKNKW